MLPGPAGAGQAPCFLGRQQIPGGVHQAFPSRVWHPSGSGAELDARRGRWRSSAEPGWEGEESEVRRGGRGAQEEDGSPGLTERLLQETQLGWMAAWGTSFG